MNASLKKRTSSIQQFLDQPLSSPRALAFILIGVLVVIIVPQVEPSDWFLNTRYLPDGLAVYSNPDFIYPPWSIGLLWIYRFMTAAGSRILSVLVLAWLVISRGWSIKHYLALILSPFFAFSMPFSNLDILVLIAPILIWEFSGRKRYSWVGWGITMSIIVVKPQGAILLIPYLFWQEKQRWREFIPASILAAILTIPISLIGNPPLVLQWLDNIRNPSTNNVAFWTANNISMSNSFHPLVSLLILAVAYGVMVYAFKLTKRQWTRNHSYIVLMTSSMLLSPYASMQSLIAALAFAPSPLAILLHWLLTFGLYQTGLFQYAPGIWVLLFSLISLWFLPQSALQKANNEALS